MITITIILTDCHPHHQHQHHHDQGERGATEVWNLKLLNRGLNCYQSWPSPGQVEYNASSYFYLVICGWDPCETPSDDVNVATLHIIILMPGWRGRVWGGIAVGSLPPPPRSWGWGSAPTMRVFTQRWLLIDHLWGECGWSQFGSSDQQNCQVEEAKRKSREETYKNVKLNIHSQDETAA